jgi:hypothetical protein
MVFLPSIALADHIDLHGAKQCLIDVGSSAPGDHERASVGRTSDVRGGLVGISADTTAAAAADATFTRRSGLEHSEHFANQGSSQVFADDRISFDDNGAIAFNDLGGGLLRQILAALHDHHDNRGRGSNSHEGEHDRGRHRGHEGGGSSPSDPSADPAPGPNPILVPSPVDATPNPEPASMLLIGTGLAGLFGFRRRLLP